MFQPVSLHLGLAAGLLALGSCRAEAGRQMAPAMLPSDLASA